MFGFYSRFLHTVRRSVPTPLYGIAKLASAAVLSAVLFVPVLLIGNATLNPGTFVLPKRTLTEVAKAPIPSAAASFEQRRLAEDGMFDSLKNWKVLPSGVHKGHQQAPATAAHAESAAQARVKKLIESAPVRPALPEPIPDTPEWRSHHAAETRWMRFAGMMFVFWALGTLFLSLYSPRPQEQ